MPRFLLTILFALLSLPLLAETTRFWRQEKYEEFERGQMKGVALRSDGELLLAPQFVERADASLEFLWAMVRDAQGNLYVGGGSPAKVIKINPQGLTSTFFESKELEVHALTFCRAGNLFVATSPDGKIYKVTPTSQVSEIFNPERKYIWDIIFDPQGYLYVATGDKGEIFRVSRDGTGEVFFASGETHVRALALDAEGNLIAGTEPNGRILRISPQGEGFVLYEMPRKEVTALAYDPQGNLYVAAIGQKVPLPAFPRVPVVPTLPTTTPTTTVTTQATVVTPTPQPTPQVTTIRPVTPPTAGGSSIYRIAPDGYPQEWWTSEEELVYSLAFDNDATLLAATGNEGKILAITSPTSFTNLVKSSAGQVTALLRASDAGVDVATANPGKVYTLGPKLETEGSFESDVLDAKLFSRWGRIRWQSRSNPAPGSVKLYTRSGNTSDPEKNWSPWSEAYTNAEGEPINSPPARFLQWKAVLTSTAGQAPSLAGVSVAYLRRNVAPVVEKIIVQAPGVRVQSMPAPQPQVQPAELELPPTGTEPTAVARTITPPRPPQKVEPPFQGVVEKGARSVIWSAKDENEDELEFALYYRGRGETRWKLLKDKLREKFYTWDAETLADGAYYLKVVASDAPSNPAELALTAENTSDRFEVDNTPPRIDNLVAQPASRQVEIHFTAHDSYSPLKKAEYSLNASPWQQLFPTTRTTDAPVESYIFALTELEPGEHTVVVRVYDQFDNAGLSKVTFTIK